MSCAQRVAAGQLGAQGRQPASGCRAPNGHEARHRNWTWLCACSATFLEGSGTARLRGLRAAPLPPHPTINDNTQAHTNASVRMPMRPTCSLPHDLITRPAHPCCSPIMDRKARVPSSKRSAPCGLKCFQSRLAVARKTDPPPQYSFLLVR